MRNFYLTLFAIGLITALCITYYLQAQLSDMLHEKGVCMVHLKGIAPHIYECEN